MRFDPAGEHERLHHLCAQSAQLSADIHVHRRFHHNVDLAHDSYAYCRVRTVVDAAFHIVKCLPSHILNIIARLGRIEQRQPAPYARIQPAGADFAPSHSVGRLVQSVHRLKLGPRKTACLQYLPERGTTSDCSDHARKLDKTGPWRFHDDQLGAIAGSCKCASLKFTVIPQPAGAYSPHHEDSIGA